MRIDHCLNSFGRDKTQGGDKYENTVLWMFES